MGMRATLCGRKICYGFCVEWTMYGAMFATRVTIGGAKTVCTQHLTGRWRGEGRGVVQLLPETRRRFPNCDHLTVSFGISDVGMRLDVRRYQSLFTPSSRDCEIPNAIYHNHPLINAPMTIKHSLHCWTTSLYYVPDSQRSQATLRTTSPPVKASVQRIVFSFVM